MRKVGQVASTAGNKNTYTILKEEPDEERLLYKPGH
jgi:hypothetical protein